ncbi:hypothetical protein SUGI_1164310 [Cryptomeria japonica]|uniref:probable carboxylesterase 17 n=1 Tax=Cryptomeria japonica TaxID=3369 RepID=UPI002414A27B|nr:probable carboxylesterase 17 [Cryptomeria japonica]GLJ54275.1 hypothetical protein SUGI_1164310 [Cryptomeria japonica]
MEMSSRPHNSSTRSYKNTTRVVEEIPGFLKVYTDGSVDRSSALVTEVSASHGCHGYKVCSKDVALNSKVGTWARIYIPQELIDESCSKNSRSNRVPVVFYFHGGGFCMGSAAWSTYHSFLSSISAEAECIIISVNYRLAPEHRLPVAYEDCWSAIEWASQPSSHEWIQSYGDLSRCFLAGDSAGANIGHHLAVWSSKEDLQGVGIVGVALIQPFFGRECKCRTKSEVEATDPALEVQWTDVFWRMALPEGANKDHPACNPLGPGGQLGDLKDLILPPILLFISEGDVMRDMDLEYYKAMRLANQEIRYVLCKGVGHGFQVLQPYSAETRELKKQLAIFINK